MDATHDDGLMHAFQGHAKQEESSDLDIAWKIHKDLAESCDLWLEVFICKGWRNGQSSCRLEILNSIADVSELWRLDSSTKNMLWFIAAPKLHLEDELLQRTPLHFWLRVLRNSVLVERLGAHSEDKAIGDSACSTCSLLRGGLGTIM